MDRRSFLQKSTISGAAKGFSGMVSRCSLFNNPGDANSKPSDLRITDIRGATPEFEKMTMIETK